MSTLTQTCRVTGTPFLINDWEQEFLKKMGLPLPTLCLDERHRRRLAYRNERSIYKGTCALCKKEIVSLYSPEKPHTVYCQDCWWGDGWDPTDFAQEVDFSRPFFDQFHQLQSRVPRLALMNTKAFNSDYCNITTDNKNCYLVFGGDFNEDSLYSIFNFHSRDVSDVYWVESCELLYDCINCEKCYHLKYAHNCNGCRDSAFLFECRNLSHCFGCVGLRGKEYYIFNKPYSKEEYEKKIKSFRLDTWSGVQAMKKEFQKFKLQFPHRAAYLVNSENCVGENILNAKNCDNCFDVIGPVEDGKDVICLINAKDVLSSDHVGHDAAYFYECLGSISGQNCAFSMFTWHGYNNFYCDMVSGCHDLFGCSQLKRREYCIFNKPYKKEEYLDLRARLVAHMQKTKEWGEFLPIQNSPFAYNETVAMDLFPLTREQVLAQGLQWLDEKTQKIGSGFVPPDSIHDVDDSILKETLVCEKTGRPYRLVPQELRLYKKLEVPIPHYAPETRNRLRLEQRNPRKIWQRTCVQCNETISTSYSPDRPEKVVCEKCYLKEVY
ncbi:MAG: hypothetical protein WC882_01060 [Candidatus Gracilibacteria bacterium]